MRCRLVINPGNAKHPCLYRQAAPRGERGDIMAVRDASSWSGDREAAMPGTVERQRQTISELQTPVIQVWDRVLALPIIGSVDTARTQEMSEALLQKVIDTGAEVVLL